MGIGLGVEVDQLDASRSSLVWSREVVLVVQQGGRVSASCP